MAGDEDPLAFVCGPTSFVETVASGLVELGYPPGRVKTSASERRRDVMDALDGNAIGGLLLEVFGAR